MMAEGVKSRRRILDVIMDDLTNHPHCPHGPMLLFAEKNRLFYGCSACRSRTLCPYYVQHGAKVSAAHILSCATERQRMSPPSNINRLRQTIVQLLKKKERVDYCHTCDCFVLKDETQNHHTHDLTKYITLHHFTHPSELLKPMERDKKEAQYHFSSSAVSVIVNFANRNGLSKLLCIGAPRVHEFINNDNHLKMQSLLLDLDTRYHSFYSHDKFCWYNSFNNFFFDSSTLDEVLKPFLQQNNSEGIVLVLDPPFGGRVEPLAYSVNQIRLLHQEVNKHLHNPLFKVIWICPYFMEPYILESCPNLHMLDYKVFYENHPLFCQGLKTLKKGSPVRIFTDLPPEKCELTAEEGYRFCPICRKWSSAENKHCQYCNKCSSKDGTTYIHCMKCSKCVKPSWKHCNTCKRCCLVNHTCGAFVPSRICYNCGEKGHRKSSCPQKQKPTQTAKRKRKMLLVSEKTDDGSMNRQVTKTKKEK